MIERIIMIRTRQRLSCPFVPFWKIGFHVLITSCSSFRKPRRLISAQVPGNIALASQPHP